VDAPEFLRESEGFAVTGVEAGFDFKVELELELGFGLGVGLGYAEGDTYRALGARERLRMFPIESMSTERLEYASSCDWDREWEYECLE